MALFNFLLLVFASCWGVLAEISYDDLYQQAQAEYDEIIEIRRHLHKYPELYFQEYETSKYLQNILKENNINFTTGWGYNAYDPQAGPATGILAQIGTGHPPCIGLRGDMDALPVTELADVPFKSQNGLMHACGHDAHSAMLLESAKLLKKFEDQIQGTIKFVFQPAEEVGSGAFMMVNEGMLEVYPPIEHMSGLHVSHNFPTGTIACGPGPQSAANYAFHIFVYGSGGHAAFPHLTKDPIVAATAIIRALYDMVAREFSHEIEEAGSLSITYINCSTIAQNIIPDWVEFRGKMWSFTKKGMESMIIRVNEIVSSFAKLYGCTSEIKYFKPSYPPVVNDKNLFHLIKQATEKSGQGFILKEPHFASEDFSFFSDAVPSVFFRLGTGSGAEIEGHPPTDFPTHSARFVIDERALPIGAAFHSFYATQLIEYMNTEKNISSNHEE